MPISAEDLLRYPPDWDEISAAIKWVRAGGRCECTGECGRPPGHLGPDQRCRNHHGRPAWHTGSLVILSTAHLDYQPENRDPANLLALGDFPPPCSPTCSASTSPPPSDGANSSSGTGPATSRSAPTIGDQDVGSSCRSRMGPSPGGRLRP